jgi:hypothetical protein
MDWFIWVLISFLFGAVEIGSMDLIRLPSSSSGSNLHKKDHVVAYKQLYQ